MSAATHTLGPWRVAASTETLDVDGTVVESPNGWEIRPDGPQKLGEEAADLRLIASAPSLLAALEYAMEFLRDWEDLSGAPYARKARAAIAEATGQ